MTGRVTGAEMEGKRREEVVRGKGSGSTCSLSERDRVSEGDREGYREWEKRKGMGIGMEETEKWGGEEVEGHLGLEETECPGN